MTLSDILHLFNDIWYVWILKRHKHDYKRIEDGHIEITKNGVTNTINWQRHQCTICKKIVGLDDWQIDKLPEYMLYEKLN